MPSAAALTVADRISDPMMPELDPSLLDFGPMDIDFGSKKDDPLNWNSQVLSDPMSIEIGRAAPPRNQRTEFDEDDMNIDLDLDLGLDDGPSIEIGRKAPVQTDLDNDIVDTEDKFPNDFGFEDNTRTRVSSRVPSLVPDNDDQPLDNGGILLDEGDDFFPADDAAAAPNPHTDNRLQRDSQSPLSSIASDVARELDATHINEEQEEEASMHQAKHASKKRKVMKADAETMLSSDQIKAQQRDRSAILKPASFLSRDSTLLNLISMQKNGGFVSDIMGDGRAKGWAPELRGILSIEVVRKSGDLKRKRDSGVADVSENEPRDEGGMPQLQIPDDDTFAAVDEGIVVGGDATARDESILHLPVDDGILPLQDDAEPITAGREVEEQDLDLAPNNFDETTAPLLHPEEQGAISQETKHAVHLLRDRFGASADGSPPQQRKAHILFQDLLPEKTTSKADATKMFFEVLVLATKDAVKVEQSDKEIGSNIQIRGKRSLWGAWAETEAAGEIAEGGRAPAVAAAT